MTKTLVCVAALAPLYLGAAAIAGCTENTIVVGSSPLRLVRPSGTAVERQILARHSEMAALNANLGYPQIPLITNEPNRLDQFSRTIACRLDTDLRDIYRRLVRPAQATYLLLGREGEKYVVFVVRVANVRENGSYVALEGLAYEFGHDELTPISISPTSY